MKPLALTHFFTFIRSLGGVESILRRHLQHDAHSGLASRLVAFFEPKGGEEPQVEGLGLTWKSTIARCRAELQRSLLRQAAGIAVYHNSWGLPFLAELDHASRRLALLHSDLPVLSQILRSQAGLVDGIMVVSEPLRQQALSLSGGIDPARIAVLPYPISPRRLPGGRASLRSRPLVCGVVGRIIREQKRVDRLPGLCQALERSGLDFRFEILGDGPQRAWLEAQLAGNPRVFFHGRKESDDYWRVLGTWDVVVFVSDYEGLPISLLEAMSLGVLPVHPRIRSGGDDYAARVDQQFAYAPDDFAAVAGTLKNVKEASEDRLEELRQRCRDLAAPHEGEAYERAFAQFARHMAELPRISSETLPARPFLWSDHCPFALLRRFYYRGLFQRNDRAKT